MSAPVAPSTGSEPSAGGPLLLPGKPELELAQLGEQLRVQLLSADTFGTLDRLAGQLGVEGRRVGTGADKRALVEALGSNRCAGIGNGRNDAEMLAAVRLGIAVLGPEGTSSEAIDSADLVCGSIESTLDLLLDPLAMAATLRR